MSWYEHTVFNPILDWVLSGKGVRAIRSQTLAPARGEVLEIGIGTGMNVPLYPAQVQRIVSLSPDAELDGRARLRAEERGLVIEHQTGSAMKMPYRDQSFDTVVSTLVLCTVPDPEQAVREIMRVLRPGRQFLFFEHVVAEKGFNRGMQRVLEPIFKRMNCGCSMLRDTASTIASSGLAISMLNEQYLADMPWLYRRVISGVAERT
jgi:ubiquinone/menaquinone biosynthesis C-methylase UbiE